MKKWLSRYYPRYIRSIVYMLQTSEYDIRDFSAWYGSIKNFGDVERRKKLVKTPKAVLLLAMGWGIAVLVCATALYLLLAVSFPLNYISFLILVLIGPYLTTYGIVGILFIGETVVERPIRYFILKKAKNKLRAHPGLKIAIAGSFGKTTMREILRVTLSESKKVAAAPHSYNTPLGISTFTQTLRGDEEILIFEFGEYYPGDIKELCDLVHPDIGIITGVNEAHLSKFKSLDQTAKTIFELAEALNGKPLYVNGENEVARNRARKFPNSILYSRAGAGEWSVQDPRTDLEGTRCQLVRGDIMLKISSQLLGLHHVGAFVAAADIASRLSCTPEQIQTGISKTKPFDHRLEKKITGDGVVMLDDSYNGNPDGVVAVLAFLSTLTGHRRFYITPGLVEMGSREETVHQAIGVKIAQAKIEKVVLIRNSVTPYIEQGLHDSGYQGEVLWFEDMPSVLLALPHLTLAGDVVLIQNDWPDQYK